MDKYDIKRLALILAKQAEIDAMNTGNKERNISNHEPNKPTYSSDLFWLKAEELEKLAHCTNKEL
jgi:flagellar biosynthesis component FlhA